MNGGGFWNPGFCLSGSGSCTLGRSRRESRASLGGQTCSEGFIHFHSENQGQYLDFKGGGTNPHKGFNFSDVPTWGRTKHDHVFSNFDMCPSWNGRNKNILYSKIQQKLTKLTNIQTHPIDIKVQNKTTLEMGVSSPQSNINITIM